VPSIIDEGPSDQSYITGNKVTIADVALCGHIASAPQDNIDLKSMAISAPGWHTSKACQVSCLSRKAMLACARPTLSTGIAATKKVVK
jgi:glutathione S-transferase